jgi:hypothetical protein
MIIPRHNDLFILHRAYKTKRPGTDGMQAEVAPCASRYDAEEAIAHIEEQTCIGVL